MTGCPYITTEDGFVVCKGQPLLAHLSRPAYRQILREEIWRCQNDWKSCPDFQGKQRAEAEKV